MTLTPPPTGPPEIVVFDVNETLSDLSGLGPRFTEAGIDPALLPLWFAATLRDGFAVTAAGGYAGFAEIAVPTLAGLLRGADGLKGDPDDVAAHIVECMSELELHPDVADGLRALRDAGIRIVTLSNGSRHVAETLLARAGLHDCVELYLSVADAGRWKPAPEAYAYAADRCDAPADEMALIAVHPWDVDGARRAGLRAGWLARDGTPYPPYLQAPDATGATLSELAEALIAGQ